MAEQQGTVLKAADGSVYFIRNEVLEACRVQENELGDVERMLDEQGGEVEGFALSMGQQPMISAIPVRYEQPNAADKIDPNKFGSTIMCCW